MAERRKPRQKVDTGIWRREGRLWLLERMRLRAWTQADLARALDLPPGTVSRWVHGEVAPSAENAQALADALGVDADTVLTLAGLRSRVEEANPTVRNVVATMRLLPPEWQKQIAEYAEFQLWAYRRQEETRRQSA